MRTSSHRRQSTGIPIIESTEASVGATASRSQWRPGGPATATGIASNDGHRPPARIRTSQPRRHPRRECPGLPTPALLVLRRAAGTVPRHGRFRHRRDAPAVPRPAAAVKNRPCRRWPAPSGSISSSRRRPTSRTSPSSATPRARSRTAFLVLRVDLRPEPAR